MKKPIILILASVIIFGALLLWTPVYAASPGDVLIVEVGADPASGDGIGEPGGEYLEIYNTTATAIDLNNWTLEDNGTAVITLPSITLGSGKILVLTADSTLLGSGGYNCSTIPFSHEPSSWFSNNVSNAGDHIILSDNNGTVIDALSYGSDTSILDPSAPDAFNNSGQTLQRSGYVTGGPFTDTDTASDWSASSGSGTPCDVGPTAITLQEIDLKKPMEAAPTLIFATVLLVSLSVVALRVRTE